MDRKKKKLLREQVLQEELAAYRRVLKNIGNDVFFTNAEIQMLPVISKRLKKLLR